MAALDDHLQCAIHLGYYHQPKRLPNCEHVYCLECLQDLAGTSNNRTFQCPECRRTQKLPPGGVASLRTDLIIQGIIENLTCDSCESVSKAVNLCDGCKKKFCVDCAATHGNSVTCSFTTKLQQVKKVVTRENFNTEKKNVESFLKNLNAEVANKRKEINSRIDLQIYQLYCLKESANSELDSVLVKGERRLEDVEVMRNMVGRLSEYDALVKKRDVAKLNKVRPVMDKLHQVVTKPDLLTTDMFTKYHRYESFLDDSQRAVFDYASRTQCLSKLPRTKSLSRPHDLSVDPTDDSCHVCDEDGIIHWAWSQSGLALTIVDRRYVTSTLVHFTTTGEKITVSHRKSRDTTTLRILTETDLPVEFRTDWHDLTSVASFITSYGVIVYLSNRTQIFKYILERKGGKSATYKRPKAPVLSVFKEGRKCISDVGVDGRGRVYVVDTEERSVFVYSQGGQLQQTVTMAGQTQLKKPLSICVDGFGWMLITDQDNHCVHIYDTTFKHRLDIKDDNMPFNVPIRVRVDKKKRIYVLDQGRNQLMVF